MKLAISFKIGGDLLEDVALSSDIYDNSDMFYDHFSKSFLWMAYGLTEDWSVSIKTGRRDFVYNWYNPVTSYVPSLSNPPIESLALTIDCLGVDTVLLLAAKFAEKGSKISLKQLGGIIGRTTRIK